MTAVSRGLDREAVLPTYARADVTIVRGEGPHVWDDTGRAYLVGVTGPPGAGKSTLVDRIIVELRAADQTVGILCVDPTSPYSGGAILGDRVRMQAHAEDDGVFIRSMATRGSLGGTSRPMTTTSGASASAVTARSRCSSSRPNERWP